MSFNSERIAIIGLGYVGLPVAVGLARKWCDVVGYDVSEKRVAALQDRHDWTGEVSGAYLESSGLKLTAETDGLSDRTFFIVTVPTPIDEHRTPDLSPIRRACEIVGPALRQGSVVVFESTVYPGVTDDFCAPLLEEYSGLRRGRDFTLGYSPERINPGDKVHRLETITKIVAAEDQATLDRLVQVYGSIIDAGLHIAPTIKVAEAAKVIENTQRDLNIALMNELSIILDKMDIRTHDVLAAAGTKWNFLRFTPGLVGGHCIGVDPYYLTHASEMLGHKPQVILAGREINDSMGQRVADKAIKLLIATDRLVKNARVGILGLTFKEDVPDIRNSKVPDILLALRDYGVNALVHDPLADAEDAARAYGVELVDLDQMIDLDLLIVAVNHGCYVSEGEQLAQRIVEGGVLIDVKSILNPARIPENITYWSL